MLNLFSLKEKKEEGGKGGGSSKKKASAAQLRITKDINELELPKTCKTEFPDPDDLLSFKLVIYPDEVRCDFQLVILQSNVSIRAFIDMGNSHSASKLELHIHTNPLR